MGFTHQKYQEPLVCPGALVDCLAIARQFVKAFVLLEVLAVAMPYCKRIKSLSISLCWKHPWHLTSFPFSIACISFHWTDIGSTKQNSLNRSVLFCVHLVPSINWINFYQPHFIDTTRYSTIPSLEWASLAQAGMIPVSVICTIVSTSWAGHIQSEMEHVTNPNEIQTSKLLLGHCYQGRFGDAFLTCCSDNILLVSSSCHLHFNQTEHVCTPTTPSKESTIGNHNQQATNTTTDTSVKHKLKKPCNHGKLHSTLKRYSFHTSLPDVPQSPLLCRSSGSPTVSSRNMSKSPSMLSTSHSMSTVVSKLACKWRYMRKTTKLWSEVQIWSWSFDWRTASELTWLDFTKWKGCPKYTTVQKVVTSNVAIWPRVLFFSEFQVAMALGVVLRLGKPRLLASTGHSAL